jgi:iron complex outermembrane recepter protein
MSSAHYEMTGGELKMQLRASRQAQQNHERRNGRLSPPRHWVVLTLLVQIAVAQPAYSAEWSDGESVAAGAPNVAVSAPVSDLDEIIVTARRRDENLERVPVSITALGPAQLTAGSVHTEQDLQLSVPGLTVRETANQNQLTYAIRGQTIDQFSSSSPAVLVYYDNIEASSTISTNFFDLDSVQVLKGPQGTLFGRNSTGGAVLFSSAKPTEDLSGYAMLRFANYGLHEFQGAIGLPVVSDKVLLRVAADVVKSDGYVHNLYDNSYLGAQDQKSGRVSLVVKPTDALSNTTVIQYSDISGTNVAPSSYSVNGCGSTNSGIPLADTAACLFSPTFPGWAAYLAAHPGAYPGGIVAYTALQRSRGPWTVDFNEPAANESHSGYLSNSTQYNFSNDLLIKSIFGYSDTLSHQQYDIDGSPYGIFFYTPLTTRRSGDTFDNRSVSEEIQVQGKAFDRHLDYIVGMYYAADRSDTDFPLSAIDLSPAINPAAFEYDWRNWDVSKAVFTQGTYDLSAFVPNLSFTGGVRYTWEHIVLRELQDSIFYGAQSEAQSLSHPSWTVGFEYQATPEALIYLSQRGSWRTGGFNGVVNPIPVTADKSGNLFKSETTEDVEVGAKYNGHIAGRPLRLNVAAYNQWVHDVQRTLYILIDGNASSITGNIPEAQISGVELDGDFTPVTWLRLGVSFAYTDARYTSPVTNVLGNTITYGPYADTPRSSGSVFAQFTLPAPSDWGEMLLRADVYSQTKQYFSNLNATVAPQTELPGYGLVNLRYDWNSIGGSRFTAAAYVKNLTDRIYYTGGLPQGAGLGFNIASGGQPRMFGAELKYKF